MKVNDRMVWIELATSGPDPEADHITRISTVVTDKELGVLGDGSALPVEDTAAAQAAILEVVKKHVLKGAGLLAGTRVQEVRLFLAAHLPELFEYLHYRNIDVSTLRELVRRWYPDVYADRPQGDGTIEGAIAELRYYRGSVFATPEKVIERAAAAAAKAASAAAETTPASENG